jgi:EAL domain-containing protein (putative c-di-GMP-specific phosphodiesterase class I)/cellobiose-specific phosphotransferase system component IIC
MAYTRGTLKKINKAMQRTFTQFSQKIADSVLILSLREAFISLLPYLILMSVASLLTGFVETFPVIESGGKLHQWIVFVRSAMQTLAPLAIVIAIGYYVSQNIGINTLAGSMLAAACFVTNSGYMVRTDDGFTLDMHAAAAYVILVPILTTYLLSYLDRLRIFNFFGSRFVSVFLIKNINLIFPFMLAFFAVYLLLPLLADAFKWLWALFVYDAAQRSIETSFVLWSLLVHFFWLLGIHGETMTFSIMNTQFFGLEILPSITLQKFVNAFITLGGAGSVWGFIIAIFLVSRDRHLRQIARLSLPFNVFNISEILTYGVPIVLNPYFFIPYMICPLVNFMLAYIAVGHGLVPVVDTTLSWMTPALVSGYIIGGGSLVTPLFQVFLIAINALIYAPFVRMYRSDSTEQVLFERLSSKLSMGLVIDGKSERHHISEQGRRIQAYRKLKQIIDDITEGELLLHYQPKMDVGGRCHGFEALLRLKQKNGVIAEPSFLQSLEDAGFSDAIDWWVIERAAGDLRHWQLHGFEPQLSINLNPYLLQEDALIDKLIHNFAQHKGRVEIEILETAYIQNFVMIRENINKLKSHGIHTAIDDFGTGFSSLSLLYKLNADTIKLDRSILENTRSEKGRVLYNQLCSLCKKLGFMLVAEGVETEQEAEFVLQAGVNLMQGWLYSHPLPADAAMQFALKANSNL